MRRTATVGGERSPPLPLSTIGPDTPLRLDAAAALAFPDGSMTVSGFRREAARGRLEVERIAGKDYTTLAAIERMRELCRLPPKAPGSGSGEMPTAPAYGSSRMADNDTALVAARMTAKALKSGSPPTSPPNMRRRGANVISIKPGSQMS
jgi:hypothetical protein